MQPTLLGWLGYHDLLDASDVFILDDLAAISPKSWHVRNRIRARDGNVTWLSIPVHAKRGQPLREVRIANEHDWQAKHLRTLESAYGRAPYWEFLEPVLSWAYSPANERSYLTTFTGGVIKVLALRLGITTPIVRASTLDVRRTGRIERLADMLYAVDATELLDTAGARTVLNTNNIEGIPIRWHDYQHPVYRQGGQEFMPYLSILDAVAYCGPDTLAVVRSGRAT